MWAGAVSLALWSSIGVAQPTAGDLETARALYKQGKDLREAGKTQEARDKFKAAHAVGQTPITGLELARTHVALGEIVEAREVCLGIARIPVASDETERSAAARTEAAQLAETLKPKIPALLIKLPALVGAAPSVAIDGRPIPAAAAGEPRKVNPGTHEIVVTFPDGTQSRQQVAVSESETKEVVIPLPPPGSPVVAPPATAPTPYQPYPPPAPRPRGSRSLPGYAWAGFALAGTGALAGSITGLMAVSKSKDLETACPNRQCTPESYNDLDTGRRLGNISNVAWGVALVGLVVGGAGWLSSQSDSSSNQARVSPFVGPGSVGMEGAF